MHLDAALSFFRELNDVLSEAHANQAYGQLATRRDSYREADTFFELALRAYNSLEDRTGACSTLQLLADANMRQNKIGAADENLATALKLSQDLRDKKSEGVSHRLMANCKLREAEEKPGNYSRALEHLAAARQAFSFAGKPCAVDEALTLQSMGNTRKLLEEYPDALKDLDASVALFETTAGFTQEKAQTLLLRGEVKLHCTDVPGALEDLGAAKTLFQNVASSRGEAKVLVALGQAHSDLGDRASSIEALTGAIAIFNVQDDLLGMAEALQIRGEVHLNNYDPPASNADMQRCLELFNGEQVPQGAKPIAPEAFPPGGGYVTEVTIGMATETTGCLLYYTLDGSAPTADSRQFSQAVPIFMAAPCSTTLRMVAIKDGRSTEGRITVYDVAKATIADIMDANDDDQ